MKIFILLISIVSAVGFISNTLVLLFLAFAEIVSQNGGRDDLENRYEQLIESKKQAEVEFDTTVVKLKSIYYRKYKFKVNDVEYTGRHLFREKDKDINYTKVFYLEGDPSINSLNPRDLNKTIKNNEKRGLDSFFLIGYILGAIFFGLLSFITCRGIYRSFQSFDKKYEKNIHEITNRVIEDLWSGLYSSIDIEERLNEYFQDVHEQEFDKNWLHSLVLRLYNDFNNVDKYQIVSQDMNKLNDVFKSIAEKRIVGFHNAGWDTREAVFNSYELAKTIIDQGFTVRGYCYYNEQSIPESSSDDFNSENRGSLWIGYSDMEEDDEAKLEIAKELLKELESARFRVRWSGNENDKIQIVNFNWRVNSETLEEFNEELFHKMIN